MSDARFVQLGDQVFQIFVFIDDIMRFAIAGLKGGFERFQGVRFGFLPFVLRRDIRSGTEVVNSIADQGGGATLIREQFRRRAEYLAGKDECLP